MRVRPEHYDLEFEPDLAARRFSGSARIRARAASPTSSITLNAAELRIRACSVSCGGAGVRCTARADAASETLTVRTAAPVRGELELSLRFEGTLNDRLLGFYASTHGSGARAETMATTQFEAADARRAFPCWDEPAAKATFAVTIVAEPRLEAVSNMPVRARTRRGRKVAHAFETTPPMSTYLLYLGVGRFESVSAMHGRVRIRVLASRGNAARARFALRLARRLLAEYESYFGIRYPLPKLDLIAVPDFAAGAMENWGAITFREALLLHDERTSSTRTKQLIAEVVSHEIAHQWFGNLVTMKWWNDLWLNESFATFMATKFVDKIYPGWSMWEQFAADTVGEALRLDSLASTHPIDVAVSSPAQIREIFDAISYDKGGSVLQMLERHVGEPAFRRGLRSYLRRHAYSNAEGADLWREIGRAAGARIGGMVESWLRQPGYPLVSVERSHRTARLSQSRFMLDSKRRAGSQTWVVPVEARAGSRKARTLLSARRGSMRLPAGRAAPVINAERAGFFRVSYEDGHLGELRGEAAAGRLCAIDAWALQSDAFALCRAGRAPARGYLEITDACSRYESFLVAGDVMANLQLLRRLAHGEPFEWRLRERVIDHCGRIHARLGWDARRGEAHTDAMLRAGAIAALGAAGHARVVSEALARFDRSLRRPASLAPDLRGAVYSTAAAARGRAAHAPLMRLYESARTQEEKVRALASMCSSSDARVLRGMLEMSQGPRVRSQDMHVPVMRAAANPAARELLWPWVRRSWPRIRRKVGRGNPLLARVVSSVALAARDEGTAAELERFFAKNPEPGTERAVSQAAETIRINARLVARMRSEFA